MPSNVIQYTIDCWGWLGDEEARESRAERNWASNELWESGKRHLFIHIEVGSPPGRQKEISVPRYQQETRRAIALAGKIARQFPTVNFGVVVRGGWIPSAPRFAKLQRIQKPNTEHDLISLKTDESSKLGLMLGRFESGVDVAIPIWLAWLSG